MKNNAAVDRFIAEAGEWQAELIELRSILQSSGLEETVKWGGPVYTCGGKNVVGLGGFKSYFGLWFYQGALLADKQKLLINAQEGRTKALRQMRFRSMGGIDRKAIKAYVKEAIGLVRQGLEIKPVRNQPIVVPAELQTALEKRAKLKAGFERLTPGKRREYVEYVASAKRDETKRKRIEKIVPMIAAGLGLNDKYRDC